ncbi:MAG: RNA 2',3'-cyclic phosphodiesterase [Candidatus Gastranaerophilales bacterium]|nr:RNA 2',3'-cyclic phosphodiesterase [Candidatus Gastranaerophilales bacterium]
MNNKSDNIRLFVGTYINLDFLFPENELNILQEQFDNSIKWVEKENIHLTWKYIGDLENNKLDQVITNLHAAANSINDITVILKKVVIWPNNKFPRQLVIIGDDTNGNATKLYKDINLKLVNLGVKKEKRSFNPHITLARFRLKNKPSEPFNIPDGFKFDEVKFDISNINLIQSSLTPKGSIYNVLNSFNLNQNQYLKLY